MQKKATENGNSYENMVSALSRLGLTAQCAKGYHNQFGIALGTRTPFALNNLHTIEEPLKSNNTVDQLVHLGSAMEIPLEELSMFIDAPANYMERPAFYVAAKNQGLQTVKNKLPSKLGTCDEYRANDIHSVRPIFDAEEYYRKFNKGPAVVDKNNHFQIRMETDIQVVKQPDHGRLELSMPNATAADDISKYDYHYIPEKDYVGLDNFQFQVSLNGESLSVYYQVKVFPEDENPNYVGYCDWEKYMWKISLPTPEGSSPLASILSTAGDRLTFADLTGSEVGQTAGIGPTAQITLDTDAAGHGWYIDYTPYLNDEYLPTSNPLEWVAIRKDWRWSFLQRRICRIKRLPKSRWS